MELSICRFEKLNGTQFNLTFAGAKRPVYLMQRGAFHTLKPTKRAVGGCASKKLDFMQTEILLNKGDLLYLLTDGFQDQFGGPKGKKFMIKKMREYVLSISNCPMQEQHQKIRDTFMSWKGEAEQVDDVCVIGVKI